MENAGLCANSVSFVSQWCTALLLSVPEFEVSTHHRDTKNTEAAQNSSRSAPGSVMENEKWKMIYGKCRALCHLSVLRVSVVNGASSIGA